MTPARRRVDSHEGHAAPRGGLQTPPRGDDADMAHDMMLELGWRKVAERIVDWLRERDL
jgi:hypothetical protein